MMLSLKQFAKELTPIAKVLELRVVFRPCEIDNDAKTASLNNSLINVPEQLRLKYRDFFNVDKAEQQPSHRPTDHAIELRPDSEPPYMRTYNMSPAELKALNEYLIKA